MSTYNIKVSNPNSRIGEITKIKLDGQIQEKNEVKLVDDGKIHEIEAEI